jgi:hypothetical protein
VFESLKVAVRIQVARFDVVRAGDHPEFLGLLGRLEERVRVANWHDLVECAVGK